jgi:glycosyltransferase involved in cell wall biosynthesis
MTPTSKVLISVIIPMKNEADNVRELYRELTKVFATLPDYRYEFIFVDDGSTDKSILVVQALERRDPKVRLVRLARNFGKEIATTAGLHKAKGRAAIMIDADLQHPPAVIPDLIAKWREGYDIVIGRRRTSKRHGNFLKRASSRWFYRIINRISTIEIVPNATDFRLLDKVVIEEFKRFTEHNRMTRGLIDWLGFSRAYVDFVPAKRLHGQAAYNYSALIKLALSTVVSLSFFPLRLAGYLGVLIILTSGPLGIFVFIERFILDDPLQLHFTGTAILAILLLFMIGIVLACLGLISLYIADIHGEVANRPLYVEKRRLSR